MLPPLLTHSTVIVSTVSYTDANGFVHTSPVTETVLTTDNASASSAGASGASGIQHNNSGGQESSVIESSFVTSTRTHAVVGVVTVSLTDSAGSVISTGHNTTTVIATQALTLPVSNGVTSSVYESTSLTTTRTHSVVEVATISLTDNEGYVTGSTESTQTVISTQALTLPVDYASTLSGNQFGASGSVAESSVLESSFVTSTRTHAVVQIATISLTDSAGSVTSSQQTTTVIATQALTLPVSNGVTSSVLESTFITTTRTHSTVEVATISLTDNAGSVTASSESTQTVVATQALTLPLDYASTLSGNQLGVTGSAADSSVLESSFVTSTRTHAVVQIATISLTDSAGSVTATSQQTSTVIATQALTLPVSNGVTSSVSESEFITTTRTHSTVQIATISLTDNAGSVTSSQQTQTVQTTEALTLPLDNASTLSGNQLGVTGSAADSSVQHHTYYTTYFSTQTNLHLSTVTLPCTNSNGKTTSYTTDTSTVTQLTTVDLQRHCHCWSQQL
ncbi:unnamed protein product [Ambrosiozyma monospora]|uniref:Unnamed protein product n=1 Tax=Ambrosiozyma monospora TaxID=43982 RepID=A0ACB5TAB4_AMBMO|nr:unnamed protein product [Ambrosiozyma monospora]